MFFLIPIFSAIGSAVAGAVSTAAAVGSAATAIGTAATTAISSAGQFLSTIATKIPPILEPPADSVKKILGFMEKISKNIGEQSNDEIRNMEAYNPENATISQLQNLNSILNNMRNELKEDIKEVEETFSVTLEDSFNKIESFIKENICSQGVNIDILALRHNFDKLINDFKNSFSDNINGRIALSDYKCFTILEIQNSEERSNQMRNYLDEIIKESLDKYFDDLDFITNNTIEFIQRSIDRIKREQLIRVNIIKKELEENINLDESQIEAKRKEYQRKEKIIDSLLETIKL